VKAVVAALAALAFAGCVGDDNAIRGDVLIRADRLFDGEEMIEPGAVLVRGDEIVEVGEGLDAEAERTFDLGDATILPGFIDLHVHVQHGRDMARGGVTTMRNVGSALSYLSPPTRDGGVRILKAGPLVTTPGGYPIPVWGPQAALVVEGAADARRKTQMLVRRGAAVIKLALAPGYGRGILSVDEVRAIVEEAHAHDVPVTAHADGIGGVTHVIDGGIDDLAHVACESLGDELLRRLVADRIEVVATLFVMIGFCGSALDNARRFVALGGTLLYGSDVGNAGVPPGIVVAELRLMRQAGLTPEQVLAAATSRPGEQIGLAPLGTLAEGAPADVIAVRGDARALRDDLARPLVVVAGGRIVHERH
jgi:imidazolonepropionase-like amidohydrolase